jgi:hypothetical protein
MQANLKLQKKSVSHTQPESETPYRSSDTLEMRQYEWNSKKHWLKEEPLDEGEYHRTQEMERYEWNSKQHWLR